jgi:hypothetical protein
MMAAPLTQTEPRVNAYEKNSFSSSNNLKSKTRTFFESSEQILKTVFVDRLVALGGSPTLTA